MNVTNRTTNYPIHTLLLNRISAKSFSSKPITKKQIETIFEAGRFAPSAQNNQPWHFTYVLKNDEHWIDFLELLAPGNQQWCNQSSALAVIVATDTILYEQQPKPQSTFALDAGLAIQNMLLQASYMNLVAHPMAGFDKEKTIKFLNLPQNWHPVCMLSFGTKGSKVEPITNRKSLPEISTHGIPKLQNFNAM